jgi:paraquat-inducible protein B
MMSVKVNPTYIGIFVFLGLVLGVCGLLLFTSSRLFTKSTKFIIYFENSLNGLNEGAPVKFRGVRIGSVYRVMIRYDQATNDPAMPVIIELQEELIRKRLEGATSYQGLAKLGVRVHEGLRARLETESLVTGVLYVDLEVESPPTPAVYHQLKPEFVEIPSRSTDIQALVKNISKINLKELVVKLSALITRADSVLERMKLEELSGHLEHLVNSADGVVRDPDLTNAFARLDDMLQEYREVGIKLNSRVYPVTDGFTNTLQQLNRALTQTRGGMENFRDTLSADSPLRNELSVTLNRLSEAAESVSTLADFLHRYPNALITGRKQPVAEKKP